MTANIKNPQLCGTSIQDYHLSVDRYPDCLPPVTKAALENLRNYPPDWNHPNSSPLPDPADISLLSLYMAYNLSEIPQPDIGWSADRTFLLYWTGKTRHVDVEIFPKEFHADLVAYNLNKPRRWLGKSLDLYDPASWQEIARLAQHAISQK